jgi:hypothetical protein
VTGQAWILALALALVSSVPMANSPGGLRTGRCGHDMACWGDLLGQGGTGIARSDQGLIVFIKLQIGFCAALYVVNDIHNRRALVCRAIPNATAVVILGASAVPNYAATVWE